MDKKMYTSPRLLCVQIAAERGFLTSSYVGIGGETEGFDTQKKEEGGWDAPDGNYWE